MKQTTNSVQLKFKKAQGQLNRVAQMYDKGAYCIDVIQQNMAVIGLLKSAQQELVEHHLRHCFNEGAKDEKIRHQMIEELIKVLNFYHK